jgi:PrcB C-terminal
VGFVSVLVAALAFQTSAPANSMSSMRTVDQGTQSNIDEPRTVVIRSADEWSRLWRAHAADKPAPAVDFNREMIVGVFLGSRPTAGYSVQIVGTREHADGLVVEYRAGSPSRDMMTAQVITTPYHLVAVPKRTGEVRFEKIAASEPRP